VRVAQFRGEWRLVIPVRLLVIAKPLSALADTLI
jgi:hypothetical protein